MQHYFFSCNLRTILKSVIPILFLALTCTFSAAAEEGYGLTVKMKTGEEMSFLLAQKPIITFDKENCLIDCGGVVSTFEIPNIDLASFETVSGEVEEIATDNVTLDLTNPEMAIVKGLKSGDNVVIYSIDGLICASDVADSNGEATLLLSGVKNGSIYIISVNNVTNFKLYKK